MAGPSRALRLVADDLRPVSDVGTRQDLPGPDGRDDRGGGSPRGRRPRPGERRLDRRPRAPPRGRDDPRPRAPGRHVRGVGGLIGPPTHSSTPFNSSTDAAPSTAPPTAGAPGGSSPRPLEEPIGSRSTRSRSGSPTTDVRGTDAACSRPSAPVRGPRGQEKSAAWSAAHSAKPRAGRPVSFSTSGWTVAGTPTDLAQPSNRVPMMNGGM